LKGPSDEELASRSGDGGRIRGGQSSLKTASIYGSNERQEYESIAVISSTNSTSTERESEKRVTNGRRLANGTSEKAHEASEESVASRGGFEPQVEIGSNLNGPIEGSQTPAVGIAQTNGQTQVRNVVVNQSTEQATLLAAGSIANRPAQGIESTSTERESANNEQVALTVDSLSNVQTGHRVSRSLRVKGQASLTDFRLAPPKVQGFRAFGGYPPSGVRGSGLGSFTLL